MRKRIVLVAVVILAVFLVLSLLVRQEFFSRPSSVVPGWQDISPPSPSGLFAPQQVDANYALSPDVPGLMVACLVPYHAAGIGGPEFGPAALWRTRDGGKHWQKLADPPFTTSCKMAMPRGGKGLIVTIDQLGNDALFISQDAGSHWSKVQLPTTAGDPHFFFSQLAGAIYRGGDFYKVDVAPSSGPATMAVSTDDGQSWTDIPTTSAATATEATLSIAPDYRARGAWYRLAESTSSVFFEHSDNGGSSWERIQTIGPSGNGKFLDSLNMLTTSPGQPDRICAATASGEAALARLDTESHSQGTAWEMGALAGQSNTREAAFALDDTADDIFATSSDGGQSWQTAVVGTHPAVQDFSQEWVVYPGVVMDAEGNCYLAEQSMPTANQLNVPATATLWRFAPSATTPVKLTEFPGAVASITVSLGTNTAASRLVIAREPMGSVQGSCLEWAG